MHNAHNEVPTVARERQTSQEVIKLVGGRHPLPVLFWQEGEAVGPVLVAERPGCWENAVWQAQFEAAGLAGCAARRGGEESQTSRRLEPFPNQVLSTGQGEVSEDHLSSRLVAFMVEPKSRVHAHVLEAGCNACCASEYFDYETIRSRSRKLRCCVGAIGI